MESHGLSGEIHLSAATASIVETKFDLKSRGKIKIKGLEPMETFFVVR
jgi:hypothetical protein